MLSVFQMSELSIQTAKGGLDEDNSLFLSHIYGRDKVLLLYDSADDLDLVARVLPRDTAQVHILVTTRCSTNHELLKRANCVVSLGYLSPANAMVALFRWADRHVPGGGDELQFAEKIVNSSLIQGLPLAIAHIGTFVRQIEMSFCDYYGLLKSREEELTAAALDIDKLLRYFHITNLRGPLASLRVTKPRQLQILPSDVIESMDINISEKHLIRMTQFWMDESNHTYLTWQLDIESVQERSPESMRVLEFSSLMAPRNIPGRLLQSVSFPDGGRGATYQFSVALMELQCHTLVSTVETNEKRYCDVHALVQSAVFHRLLRNKDDLLVKLTTVSHYLLRNMPVGQTNITSQLHDNEFLEIIPHVYSVAEKIMLVGADDDACHELVANACRTALVAQHVDAAASLCEKQLKMVETSGMNLTVVSNLKKLITGWYTVLPLRQSNEWVSCFQHSYTWLGHACGFSRSPPLLKNIMVERWR